MNSIDFDYFFKILDLLLILPPHSFVMISLELMENYDLRNLKCPDLNQ